MLRKTIKPRAISSVIEDLYKTKVVSPQDVDQFRATAKSAQATLDAADKKVRSDKAQVDEARAQVDAYAGLVQSG